jgi:hypothetical protein
MYHYTTRQLYGQVVNIGKIELYLLYQINICFFGWINNEKRLVKSLFMCYDECVKETCV